MNRCSYHYLNRRKQMGNETNPTLGSDIEKKIRLMRFWLFGSFTIIFAASTIYVGMFIGLSLLLTWQFWAAMLLSGVLFIGAFVYEQHFQLCLRILQCAGVDTCYCFGKVIKLHRFHQIIEGRIADCLDGIVIMCSHKNDSEAQVSTRIQHIES